MWPRWEAIAGSTMSSEQPLAGPACPPRRLPCTDYTPRHLPPAPLPVPVPHARCPKAARHRKSSTSLAEKAADIRLGPNVRDGVIRDGVVPAASLAMSAVHRKQLNCCAAKKRRDVPTRDMNRPEWLRSQGILVYPPILHDNLEVLGGVGDQVDILQWISVDQQQIGKRALFHHAELARIRIAFAG